MSISASGATVTLGTSSASGETLSTTVTGGTLSAGISEGNVSTITWTATYYLNGVARTAKAYSVAYAPNIEPVASAIRTWNNDGVSDGIKAYLQAFTYATGVHTIASGGYGANRSGGKVCAPMLGTITAPGNNGVTDWFNTGASKKGTNYTNKEGGGDNIVVIRNSPTATLAVDTSRYTNISQIPNFRYGLVITDTERMSGEGYWFVSDYTDGTYKSDGDESKDGGNINAWWGTDGSAGSAGIIKDGSYNGNVGVGNGIKVGGQTGKQMFSKGISGTGTESLVIKGAAKMQNGSEWNATINLVNVSFNKVNKGTLRNNIRTYINKGLQSDDYSGDFAAYEAEIKAAAEKLGNPTNSDTSDTIASKFGALTRKTYNSTLTHKFDGRKADVTEGPTAFNSGDNITIGPNSYTGYTINSASGATTSTSNTTLYIRRSAISQTYNYVANSYTLTFDANGGSVTPGSKTVKYDFTYNYGGNLPVPTRTGYNFDGWYTAASGGTKVNDSDYVETAGNHTVYAHWTAQTYTVTFADPIGGGTPSPASKTVTYDQAYGALATISRTGYDFDGWYTAQTGGTKVEATTTVTTASNHTLYARWTAKTYTVTYDANGGSVSPGSKSVTYDSAYGTLATPTRTGYSFNGWYTAASGGSEVTASTTVTTASNHTIYAQWSINQYTITFDSAGGSAVSPITQDYGTAVTPPANPTRTGYTFNGWSPAVPSTMPAGNMTCTAQWTI
ncbi:MAG TPA: InlB B-repeat-containing protein, partial [Oscillospiraceae bacterium]|nr:InlB B-repeat-containing protein [Oscillospiraceae bacterium]